MSDAIDQLHNGETEPTITEVLRALCHRQMEKIAELRALVEQLHQSNLKLGGNLLQEGDARKAELERIRSEVGHLKDKTALVVKQRDVCVKCLRALVASLLAKPPYKFSDEWGTAHLKAVDEAEELLKVIDDAQKR